CVEDDDVRFVGGRRLPQSEGLEHALDPLAVVGVHLAAERRHVVPAHGPTGYRPRTVAFVHPDDADWDAWTPAEAARKLDGIDVPWRVSAGWAIDLFLGVERREHDDLELAVPANRFEEVADALGELEFHVVTAGIAEPVTTDAGAELMATVHQTWGLDRADGV